MQPSRATRELHIRRLFEMLGHEVTGFAPAGIWEWDELGAHVDFLDRRLHREASRYEDGTAAKEEVLAAAEAFRGAWRSAVERFTATHSTRAA